MHSKSFCIGLIFLGAFAVANAQDKKPRSEPAGTAYKQTLPDGSIIYTDKPNRSVKIEKTLAPEPAPAFTPRAVTPSVGVPPGYVLQKPPSSGLNPGAPGTPIPSMPPLPGDSVVRPIAPSASPVTVGTAAKPTLDVSEPSIEAQISKADEDLARALKMQKEGIAPEPGDRNGTASGGSRLNSAYTQRQEELAGNVQKAQAEIDRLLLKRRGQ